MMNYVSMDASHIAQIADIEAQCFSSPWGVNVLTSELSNPFSLWVVAMCEDKVVGYVGSQSVMGEADMMNLAVIPEYRRQGIGVGLVNELISRLKANNVHCLVLEVRASNEAAISLYQGLGFVEVGRRPGYYFKPREDALILRKEWEV